MRFYEKILLILKNNYYLIPFFIFFIVLLLFHYFLPTYTGDDLYFSKIVSEYPSIFHFLFDRYENWSSRFIIEFFLTSLAPLPGEVWKFLDSIIFLIISISIPKIFIKEKISLNRKLINNTASCFWLECLFSQLMMHFILQDGSRPQSTIHGQLHSDYYISFYIKSILKKNMTPLKK